jgi:hypothetical protein
VGLERGKRSLFVQAHQVTVAGNVGCKHGRAPSFDPGPVSFDHLVGTGEQRGWHGEPEGLGGLQIDGQLVLARLINWDFARPRTPEDLVDDMGVVPD